MPGQRLTLRDLLLNRMFTVAEHSASRQDIKGAILYTKVITLEGTSVMLGAFPYVVPGEYQGSLIDFRRELEQNREKLAPADLREFDFERRWKK